MRRVWRSGTTGWIALAAGVFAWNASHARDGQMLSEAFAHGVERHRTAVIATWAILTLHLFGKLPSRLDPLHQLGNAFERRFLNER